MMKLQSLITRLARQHDVDLGDELAFFWLEKPDCVYRVIVERVDEWRVSVSRGFPDGHTGHFLLDPDIWLLTYVDGWIPTAATGSGRTWTGYEQVVQGCKGDGAAQATELIEFVESFAQHLLDEGWLEHSHRLPDPPWRMIEERMDSPCGRMVGCQSTNHDQCYGELWQCAACGKRVCYGEGTDNDPDLCDDCWVKKHHQPGAPFDMEEL